MFVLFTPLAQECDPVCIQLVALIQYFRQFFYFFVFRIFFSDFEGLVLVDGKNILSYLFNVHIVLSFLVT